MSLRSIARGSLAALWLAGRLQVAELSFRALQGAAHPHLEIGGFNEFCKAL